MNQHAQISETTEGMASRISRKIDWERIGVLYARVALGAAFLSAVSGRFGLWNGSFDLKHFEGFLEYAGEVLSFMPKATIPYLAWTATVCETLLGSLLILAVWPRWVALASALLLAMFGTAMAISLGLKSPMDYSVYSASSAAVMLAIQSIRPSGRGASR